jgi:DNA-binding LacI/PurR family transcriptional regulator
VDLRLDDPRIAELERLGVPAVVVGGPGGIGGLSAVWIEDDSEVSEVVRYLARLGHRRIARVAGISGLSYTEARGEAFARVASELKLSAYVLSTDYTKESGASATRQLLTEPSPPTAIIFDNDVLAVAGLGVAQEMGLRVPDDLSLVAWDDSYYCQVVHPPLTAMARDVSDHGARAVNALFALLEKGTITRVPGARGRLTPRGSTGPAPAQRDQGHPGTGGRRRT